MENEGKKPIKMSKRKFIITIASLIGAALIAFGVLLYVIFGKKDLIEKRKLPEYSIPNVPDGYMLVFREVEYYEVKNGEKEFWRKREYNEKGQEVKSIHYEDGELSSETTYEYDENGELKREVYDSKGWKEKYTYTFSVDDDGNRVKIQEVSNGYKIVTVTDSETGMLLREEEYNPDGIYGRKISVYDNGILVQESHTDWDGFEWDSVKSVYTPEGKLSEVMYYDTDYTAEDEITKKTRLFKAEKYRYSENECVIDTFSVTDDGEYDEVITREHIFYDDQGKMQRKYTEHFIEGKLVRKSYNEYEYYNGGHVYRQESYSVGDDGEKLLFGREREYNDQKLLIKEVQRNANETTLWVEYKRNESGDVIKETHYKPDGSVEYYAEKTFKKNPTKVVRTDYYKADGTPYENELGATAYVQEYDSYGNLIYYITYNHNKVTKMSVHVYKPMVIPKSEKAE